ncbi:MAG: hypothetical protein FJ095_15300 [Deltaproteobacteria bacterium]|nr:hypothetical protein [Deltaproteobacteria bacterium]
MRALRILGIMTLAACDRESGGLDARTQARAATRTGGVAEDARGLARGAPFAPRMQPDDSTGIDAKPAAAATEVRTPRWSEPVDEHAVSRMSDAARAEVARSPVPVLAVANAKWLASMVVTTGLHWYATSVRDGELTVSIHGTRLAHVHPEIPPAEGRSRVRGKPAFVTENEGIVSASWLEDGIAYALDVECFDRADARCRSEGYALELGRKLVFVGGRGGAP